MADSPMATAPERSTAALSTMRDLQAVLLGPVGRFHRRPAGGHATPDDQEVSFHDYSFEICHL